MTTPEYIATEKGWGAMLPAPAEIARRVACGCWVIRLGQGKAFLPCALHEPGVQAVIDVAPVLPTQ